MTFDQCVELTIEFVIMTGVLVVPEEITLHRRVADYLCEAGILWNTSPGFYRARV